MRAVEQHAAFVELVFGEEASRLGHERGHQILLEVIEVLDRGAVRLEQLVVALGHGTRYDERGAGVVDQHRVHLVDDGIVVLALHEILGRRSHVVAQVVEAVFVVGSERDVGHVGLASRFGIGLVLVDAVYRQSVELVHGTHPLRVASGQIVVHRNDVHTLAGQRVEEYGQGSHERLSLSRRHLGDLALVEHHAAEQLHVVMHHVPFDVVSARGPMRRVDGLVAVDGHEILLSGKVAVERRRRHLHRVVFGEAARRVLHDGESLGQYLVQLLLDLLVNALGGGVYVFRNLLLVGERGAGQFEAGLLLDDVRLVVGDEVGDALHQLGAAGTQLVVRQTLYGRVYLLDFPNVRFYLLAILFGFRTEEEFDYVADYIHNVLHLISESNFIL